MSKVDAAARSAEQTPVDDVRRIREKLSHEANNDVRRLAERVRQAAEQMRDKLGLRRT